MAYNIRAIGSSPYTNFGLIDVVMSVVYNEDLGFTPTSIKAPLLQHYRGYDPDEFFQPHLYSGNSLDPIDGTILQQPAGWPIGASYLDVLNQYGGLSEAFGRSVYESISVGSDGRFTNGTVSLDSKISAGLTSYVQHAKTKSGFNVTNPQFISREITDVREWPDYPESARDGLPSRVHNLKQCGVWVSVDRFRR